MFEPVLVLNANFEPLNICPTRRAIGLMMTSKATLILNGRGFIHTVSQEFPRPSIIRLERMIKRPRIRVKLNKREVLRRDNYTCQYCGNNTPVNINGATWSLPAPPATTAKGDELWNKHTCAYRARP